MQQSDHAAFRAELRRNFALEVQRSKAIQARREQMHPLVQAAVESAKQASMDSAGARVVSRMLIEQLRAERRVAAAATAAPAAPTAATVPQTQAALALADVSGKLPAA